MLTPDARYHLKLALQGTALFVPVALLMALSAYVYGSSDLQAPSMSEAWLVIFIVLSPLWFLGVVLPVSFAYWRAVRRARSGVTTVTGQ